MLDSNQVQPVISSVVTPVALEGFKTPLLNEYPGASAAYSLRRLKSWDDGGRVVQVRRASDNEHRDFSAADIESGAMLRWVNATVALPLDTASGAAAAYSLRNLSASYTGNVVDVRRSSDNAEDSFTAAEVADGTLTNWVSEAPIAQNSTSNPYTTFTNASNTGFTTTLSSGVAYAGFGCVSGSSGDSVTVSFDLNIVSGSPFVALREGTGLINSKSNSQVYGSSGSYSLTMTATGDFGFIGFSEGDIPSEFTVSNFEITSVSGATYVRDGFVTQWYDQSGNGNHATQGTDASQPKIVDGGSLVSGGIEFDGVDDHLDSIPNLFSGTSAASSFIVGNADTTATSEAMFSQGANNIVGNAFVITSEIAFRPGGNTIYNDDFVNANPLLLSTIAPASSTSADVSMFLDGSTLGQISTTSAVLNYGIEGAAIGRNFATSAFYDGRLSEIIIYDSDQSANRTAIEANIGDYYSINLPGGVDPGENEVDGFVSTWYDQSGNSNDATQSVVTSQPKIVDAGVLVSGGLDFDGADDFLDASGVAASLSGTDKPLSSFAVVSSDVAATTQFILSCGRASTPTPIKNTLFHSGNNLGFQVRDDANALRSDFISSPYSPSTTYLVSNTSDGLILDFAKNGLVTSNDFDVDVGALTIDTVKIGAKANSSPSPLNGRVQEIIIYDSDQSANRVAIETNINNQYDIY